MYRNYKPVTALAPSNYMLTLRLVYSCCRRRHRRVGFDGIGAPQVFDLSLSRLASGTFTVMWVESVDILPSDHQS